MRVFDGLDDGHLELGPGVGEGADVGPGYVWDCGEAFAFGGGLDAGEGGEEVGEGYGEGGELGGG